jgi:steroid delta-isomerase-like uncharacterized protein
MSIAETKSIVTSFIDEIYTKGNFAVAHEIITEQYVDHNDIVGDILGAEGVKRDALLMRAAFPDLSLVIDDLVVEETKAAMRGTLQGTHKEAFLGHVASNKQISISWMRMFQLADGKITESWLELNVHEFHKQLS